MPHDMTTPTHEAMIKLSGVLSAAREATALIEHDPDIPAEMLASVTGLLALLGQEFRDFTDRIGRNVRTLSPGAHTTTGPDSATNVINQVNRDVEFGRRCFQSAHEHFVNASNTLRDLQPADVPTS